MADAIFIQILAILLLLTGSSGTHNMASTKQRVSTPLTQCRIQTRPNFQWKLKGTEDPSGELITVSVGFDHHTAGALHKPFPQNQSDIIDPFTWAVSRGEKGHLLLSLPFDYGMLSLGTLVPGTYDEIDLKMVSIRDVVSLIHNKVLDFARLSLGSLLSRGKEKTTMKIKMSPTEIECFQNVSDFDRLCVLADLLLNVSLEKSSLDESLSVCMERHSRRSHPVANVFLGSHITLQMNTFYTCWKQDIANHSQLAIFDIEVTIPWLESIIKLELTWYFLLFVVVILMTATFFVYKCGKIEKYIVDSETRLDQFIRCARFLCLIHIIPSIVFIVTHLRYYCKRRAAATDFGLLWIDIFHFILCVCVIGLPQLSRNKTTRMSRSTLTGFYVAMVTAVSILICVNVTYVIEIVYFTTLGLNTNPKAFELIIVLAVRSILFIRTTFDFHKFLRFDNNGLTLFQFLVSRTPHLLVFVALSIYHLHEDPHNVSPVTIALLAALLINGMWYKFDSREIEELKHANVHEKQTNPEGDDLHAVNREPALPDNETLTERVESETSSVCRRTALSPNLDFLLADFEKRMQVVDDTELMERIYQTDTFAARYLDGMGGYFEIEAADVRLFVPPGALDQRQLIYLYLDTENQTSQGSTSDAAVSPVVECGPSGLTFKQNITLSYPHCADNESQWKFETLICKKSNGHDRNWRSLANEDADVCVKNGRAIIKINHFTGFTTRGLPLGPEAVKNMRVGAFGSVFQQGMSSYKFRVRIWEDTKASTQIIREKEKYLTGRPIDDDRKLVVRNIQRDVSIKVDNLKPGWKVLHNERQEQYLPFREIWENEFPSCTVALTMTDGKDDHRTSESVYCDVTAKQLESAATQQELFISPEIAAGDVVQPGRLSVLIDSSFEEDLYGPKPKIPSLPASLFYELVKVLNMENDLGSDWRKLMCEIGRDDFATISNVKNAKKYCPANFAIKWYLMKCRAEGSDDPVNDLKEVFSKYCLHEPLRIIENWRSCKSRRRPNLLFVCSQRESWSTRCFSLIACSLLFVALAYMCMQFLC